MAQSYRYSLLFTLLLLTAPRCSCFHVPDPIIFFSIGAVAGGAGGLVAYPLDYIKAQLQTESGKEKYNNGLEVLTDILQKNPLLLYKGAGVQVLGMAPRQGIKLGVNDVLHTAFLSSLGVVPVWGQIVSGAAAGACQGVVSSPVEVLKTGLQTSDMTLGQVWKKVGGYEGLFRGTNACVVRDTLFSAVCFPLYAYFIHQNVPGFLAAAMSGVVASVVATPPDVIKTRMLSQDESTQQEHRTTIGAPERIQQPSSQQLSLQLVGVGGSNSTITSVSLMDAVPSTPTIASNVFADLDYSYHDNKQKQEQNPFQLGLQVIQREGVGVLFSGVSERCLGSIPRVGTSLVMHDFLEQVVAHHGWLSHTTTSL